MSKKHKKTCRILNYINHLLIVTTKITGFITILLFVFLVGISIGNADSVINFLKCVITAAIKKYKSKIKKKKHHKVVLLAKSKLNRIEILISKALIDSNISHNEFVLINNMLKEFCDMKKIYRKF